jgi:Fur family transcriptional regulator, ferric uptake regulator
MLQKRIDDLPTVSRQTLREAESIFHAHLKRVGLKRTGQRDPILRTFLDTRDHLSTDELYRLVKKKDTGIGFTTVYRTLKLFSECGLASEVAFNDGVARYERQYQRRNHHHMVCTECGGSVEFFSPTSSASNRKSAARINICPPATPSRSTAFATSARRSSSAYSSPGSLRGRFRHGVQSCRFVSGHDFSRADRRTFFNCHPDRDSHVRRTGEASGGICVFVGVGR